MGNVTPAFRGQGISKGFGNREFSPAFETPTTVSEVLCSQGTWKQRFSALPIGAYLPVETFLLRYFICTSAFLLRTQAEPQPVQNVQQIWSLG